MRFLIFLAVIAVAYADDLQIVSLLKAPTPVTLPEAPTPALETPEISPVMIPQEVETIKIATPIMRDDFDESLQVKVVEVAIDGATLTGAPAPAFEMPDISPLMIPQEVLDAVKIAEPIMRDDLDEALKVQFVDAPIEAANLPEAPAPAYENIEPIQLAEPRYPAKQYEDARLR